MAPEKHSLSPWVLFWWPKGGERMDAIFDSSGNVSGNSGGNRLTAWTGQGLANLLAPSSSGIASAGSLLPDTSAMGKAMRNGLSYSYPDSKVVDYAKIAEDINARSNNRSGDAGLAEAAYQSNLLSNVKKWINDINTSGDRENVLGAAYNNGVYGLGGLAVARRNYDTAKAGLDGLTADEKAWLAAQGVNIPSKYPSFHL
jgi:hypothetical protein